MGGRPPKPIELKRAGGRTPTTDSGGRKLHVITSIPQTLEVPETPLFLGIDGQRFWERAWATAITWVSKEIDREAVENAAMLADAVAAARKKYLATLEAADARAFVAINESFTKALASLGFDPVSRSRLGVAEIKIVSKLDQLIANRTEKAK